MHASCVSHFALYVAERTEHGQNVGERNRLPYVTDLVTVYYGSLMDLSLRTTARLRL